MKVFVSIFMLMVSSHVFSSPIPDFPFVTVTGESSRNVTPDNAVINIEVVTFAKESLMAQEALNNTIRNIFTILEKSSVSTESITSNEIRKETKRAREKNGYNNLDILGYELSQVFEIKLDNLAHYSLISSELVKTNNVKNVKSHFDVKNRDVIEIELITEAGEQAKLKANQMASGVDVKIGSVFAINDSGSYQSFFATFGLDSASGHRFSLSGVSNTKSMFVPKYIKISKSINVVYKLED